jgi:hypothetical protein
MKEYISKLAKEEVHNEAEYKRQQAHASSCHFQWSHVPSVYFSQKPHVSTCTEIANQECSPEPWCPGFFLGAGHIGMADHLHD